MNVTTQQLQAALDRHLSLVSERNRREIQAAPPELREKMLRLIRRPPVSVETAKAQTEKVLEARNHY